MTYRNSIYNVDLPGSISDYTLVGSVQGVDGYDKSININSYDSVKPAYILKSIPGTVTIPGNWQIRLKMYVSFQSSATYPSMGLVVTNGTTATTSTAIFSGIYNFNSNVHAFGVWREVLVTQTRPSADFGNNASSGVSQPYYIRILCDGTNYYYQLGRENGSAFYTMYTNTIAAYSSVTPTHYGVQIGDVNGSGYVNGTVVGLGISPNIIVSNISNATLSNRLYTITTSTPHNLKNNDTIIISSVTGTGTLPNGTYDSFLSPSATILNSGVNVTSPTTFTLQAYGASSFSYTSGGKVLCTSR